MDAAWWFDDDPEPDEPDVWHLFTAAEAERTLGVPAARIRVWACRGRITLKGIDERGRAMYERADLLALHQPMRK